MRLVNSERRPASPFLFAVAAVAVACSPVEPTPSVAVALDSLMTGLYARGHFSGALVVHREGEIVYERGFGFADFADEVPFTPDTPTNGASLTKTLTAAALLMFEAEGRIGLDDLVTRYLPALPYPAVTVRHLLTHSSGLRTSPPGEPPPGETITNELELEVLAERAPALSFEPGSGFQYSNLSYDLAAMVLERVADASYASVLEERIFRPLGMDSAFVRPAWNRDWSGVRTRSYREVDGKPQVIERFDGLGIHGSTGIYLSARDLHKWAVSFYSNPVLDEGSLRTGLEAPILGAGHKSAMNLLDWYGSDDGRRFYFTGVDDGFYSFVYWDADRRHSVVMVSNMQSLAWHPALLKLALVDILEGRPPRPVAPTDLSELNLPPLPPTGPLPTQIESLLGTYDMGPAGTVTIGVREECRDTETCQPFFVQIDGGLEYPILAGQFGMYAPGPDASVSFTETADGKMLHWASVFGGAASGRRISR